MRLFYTLLITAFLTATSATAFAAKDTPNGVLKNRFYKSLQKISKEQKYPLVMKNIHTRLSSQYSSKKDLNAAMFWLRDEYLYNDGDPKYGLSYVQFLESISGTLKDSDKKQSHTLKLNSVIHYFVFENFILSDIAYCEDQTAGTGSKSEIVKIRQNYLNRYSSFSPEDKENVYKSIFNLIDERQVRTPYTEICKSGQMHMKKAVESGQYKEDFSMKDGTRYIDDNLTPDLVDLDTWGKRKNALYNALQQDLLAIQ